MNKTVISLILLGFIAGSCAQGDNGKSPQLNVPVKLSFSSPGQAVLAGACSSATQVQLKDYSGNLVPLNYDKFVSLTSAATSLTFYSDSTCSKTISSLKLPAGSSSATFYFKNLKSEYVTINASTTNLQSDSQSFTVMDLNASIISFNGPANAAVGTCAGPFTIKTQNANGDDSIVNSDVAIDLAGNGTGFYYGTADCSGAKITSTVVLKGTKSTQVYYKNNKTGIFNLKSIAPGSISSNTSVTMKTDGPSQISIMTTPQTINAGACSNSYLVQAQDAYGNETPVIADQTVLLSGTGVQFYTSSKCIGSPVSSVLIKQGDTSATFYLSSNSIATQGITVQGLGIQTQSLTVLASNPQQISVDPLPSSLTAGSLIPKFNVAVQDQFGNTVPTATKPVNVAAYSDSSCSIALTSGLQGNTQISPKNGIASFSNITYTKASTVYLGFSSSTFSNICSGPIQVNPDFANKSNISGPNSGAAGVCQVLTLTTSDQYGNASAVPADSTISLSGNGSGSFFSSSDCSGSTISAITVLKNTSSSTLSFKDNKAENLIFVGSGFGVTDSNFIFTVFANTPTKVAFSGASSITAGQCASGYTLKIKDDYGNDSPVASDTAISVQGNGSGSFYSDSSCVNSQSSISVLQGTNSKQIFFKDLRSEVLTLNFNYTNPANFSLAVVAGSVAKLAVSVPNAINAGNYISPLQIQIQDQYSNIVTNADQTVSVATYSDVNCLNTSSISATGTLSKATVSGVVSFNDVSYTKAETIYLGAKYPGINKVFCSTAIVVNPNNPSSLLLSGPNTVKAGTCSAMFSLNSADQYGNITTASANLNVNLSGNGSGTFYLNSDCSDQGINALTLSSGSTSSTFYFKDTTAENLIFSATNGSYLPANLMFNVSSLNPTKISMVGSQSFKAGDCVPFTVSANDVYGNLSVVSVDVPVSLSGFGHGQIYSDSSCKNLNSNPVIHQNNTSAQVFFMNSTAETLTFNVSTSLYGNTNFGPVNVLSAVASKLVYNAPSTGVAGKCIGPFDLITEDIFNNVANVDSDLSINLSGMGNGNFYTDSSCSNPTVNSTLITAGQNKSSLYFKDNKNESLTISVAGIGTASYPLQINSDQASQLVFTSPPQAIVASQCSGTVSVRSQDSLGNFSAVSNNTVLSLTGDKISFYDNQYCTGSTITSITMNANTDLVRFYISGNIVTSSSIIISGLGIASQPVTVNFSDPAKLAITQYPSTGTAGANAISSALVQVQDKFGNLVTSAKDSISIDSYSDASCSNLTSTSSTGIKVISATSGVTAFSNLGYNKAESIYLGAKASGLTASCVGPVTVAPAPVSKIVINSSKSFVPAGACSDAINLTAVDFNSNVSKVTLDTLVNLSNTGHGSFYSTNDCSGSAISSASIKSGTSVTPVYYSGTLAEQFYLVSGSIYGTNNFPFSVTPLSAVALKMVGDSSIVSKSCSTNSFSVITTDTYGNASNVINDTVVSLSGNGNGSYYLDSSCSHLVSNFTMSAGTSSVQFYFLDNSIENLTLAASGLGSTTFPLTVSAPLPTKLAFSGQTVLTTGQCSLVTISSVDNSGSVANVTSANNISFTGFGSGVFYSDSSCVAGSEISNAVIPAGQSQVAFYFKDTKAETLSPVQFTSDKQLTAVSTAIQVNVSAADHLLLTSGNNQTGIAGAQLSSPIQVQVVDQYNNPIPGNASSSPIKVAFDPLTSGGSFSSTSVAIGTDGIASSLFTLGPSVQVPQTFKAYNSSLPGIAGPSSITFNASSKNGPPANLVLQNTLQATVKVGLSLTPQPLMNLYDTNGNLTLDQNGTISFTAYSDSNCSIQVSNLTGGSATLTAGTGSAPSIIFSTPGVTYLKATVGSVSKCFDNSITVFSQFKATPTKTVLNSGETTTITIVNEGGSTNCVLGAEPNYGSNIDSSCSNYTAGYNYTGSNVTTAVTLSDPYGQQVTINFTILPEPYIGSVFQSVTGGSSMPVSVYKNFMIVGSPNENFGSSYTACGAVYVYKDSGNRTKSSWSLDKKITPAQCKNNLKFGSAVSINGSVLAVGAPGDSGPSNNISNSGGVYLYNYDSSSQSFKNEFIVRNAVLTTNDLFGSSVSVSNGMVAVGAIGVSSGAGAVYTYKQTDSVANTWSLHTSLTSTGSGTANYGNSVSLYYGFGAKKENGYLAVGAPNQAGTGKVYVYQSILGGTFASEATVTSSDIASGDKFGSSVSLFGPYLAVGAPGKSSGNGAAYVYKNITGVYGWAQSSSNSWTAEAKISPTTLANGSGYGSAISLFGNFLAVGAKSSNLGAQTQAGAAYLFQKTFEQPFSKNDASSWTFNRMIAPINPSTSGQFGSSLALYDNRIIVGSNNGSAQELSGNWTYNIWPFGFDGPQNVSSGTTTILSRSVYDYSSITVAQNATLVIDPSNATQISWTFLGSKLDMTINGTITAKSSPYTGINSDNMVDEDGLLSATAYSTPVSSVGTGGKGGNSGSTVGANANSGKGGKGADGVGAGGSGGLQGNNGNMLYLKANASILGNGTIDLSGDKGSDGNSGGQGVTNSGTSSQSSTCQNLICM